MEEVKLQNAWRFWHQKPQQGEVNWNQESDKMAILAEFDSVQQFWSIYNNLPPLSTLNYKETFHLMKNVGPKSIKPVWEDPQNKNGGEWFLKIAINDAQEVWLNLNLALIGEQFKDKDMGYLGDEVCGLSASLRTGIILFQLWYKDSQNKDVILKSCLSLLPGNVKPIENPYSKDHHKNLVQK